MSKELIPTGDDGYYAVDDGGNVVPPEDAFPGSTPEELEEIANTQKLEVESLMGASDTWTSEQQPVVTNDQQPIGSSTDESVPEASTVAAPSPEKEPAEILVSIPKSVEGACERFADQQLNYSRESWSELFMSEFKKRTGFDFYKDHGVKFIFDDELPED
jgi:hypothetical protein